MRIYILVQNGEMWRICEHALWGGGYMGKEGKWSMRIWGKSRWTLFGPLLAKNKVQMTGAAKDALLDRLSKELVSKNKTISKQKKSIKELQQKVATITREIQSLNTQKWIQEAQEAARAARTFVFI